MRAFTIVPVLLVSVVVLGCTDGEENPAAAGGATSGARDGGLDAPRAADATLARVPLESAAARPGRHRGRLPELRRGLLPQAGTVRAEHLRPRPRQPGRLRGQHPAHLPRQPDPARSDHDRGQHQRLHRRHHDVHLSDPPGRAAALSRRTRRPRGGQSLPHQRAMQEPALLPHAQRRRLRPVPAPAPERRRMFGQRRLRARGPLRARGRRDGGSVPRLAEGARAGLRALRPVHAVDLRRRGLRGAAVGAHGAGRARQPG